jgi:hypothetical protein
VNYDAVTLAGASLTHDTHLDYFVELVVFTELSATVAPEVPRCRLMPRLQAASTSSARNGRRSTPRQVML